MRGRRLLPRGRRGSRGAPAGTPPPLGRGSRRAEAAGRRATVAAAQQTGEAGGRQGARGDVRGRVMLGHRAVRGGLGAHVTLTHYQKANVGDT